MKTGRLLALAAAIASAASSTAECAQRADPQPVASNAACRLNPVEIPASVRPRHEAKKALRIQQVDADLARTRADVLVLGDSITERWPQASLQSAYPGERVLNAGVSGDRVNDLLFRLSGQTSRIADMQALGMTHWRGQSPRLVTIMIGTNDLRGATPCYIASGIVAAAGRAHALYPKAKVVVLSILPRGNPQGQFGDELGAVNALVAAEAKRSGQFQYLDLTPAFTCQTGANCDLAIPRAYVHPTDTGYAKLAAALRARLARR